MPASDAEISITKLVTVHPQNAARGLPTIQGEVVVMEAATGLRLGLLDGAVVTARRTAAVSMLAARELAPRPEGPLLLVGAGTQGRSHLEAFGKASASRRSSSFPDYRERLSAGGARGEPGDGSRRRSAPEDALGEATLLVTATTSREPVLPEEVREDAFVAAVGSFEPEAAELPPALISRSTVVVDTTEGAREEAGDLLQAESAGAFRWESAVALEDALRWPERPGGPVVFESVGHALWDLAAARTPSRESSPDGRSGDPPTRRFADYPRGYTPFEVIYLRTRTLASVCALAAALVFVLFPTLAAAQDSDTIYDEADVLSDSEEQQVQEEFDAAQQDTGQPLYAFLVPDTGVVDQADQRKLLEREAREEDLPQDAGVIVVAPNDGWAQLANIDGTSEQAVYEP
jgi:ornithine cyclodeaminase